MNLFEDPGLEALSWRLASDLMRRHPVGVRLIRGHPGGGQYDVLWILDSTGGGGNIPLNREGTIQVHERFDRDDRIDWEPTTWDDYRATDPRVFVQRLEVAAGLPVPSRASPATPTTLTYRVLAEIASLTEGTGERVEIQMGYFDTSGYGGGPNDVLTVFPIPGELLRATDDDLFGEAGYRFWIAMRDDCPIIAFEQSSGLAWIHGRGEPVDVMGLYSDSNRNARTTAIALLRRVDEI